MASGIYRIRNTENERCYVGSTVDLDAQIYNHRWHLENATHKTHHLQASWDKHGSGAFEFQILQVVASPALLLEREQAWINLYRSHRRDLGYNLNPITGSNLARSFGADVRARMAAGAKRSMSDPQVKARHHDATRRAMQDPDLRARTREAAARRAKDPSYLAKMAALYATPEWKAAASMRSKAAAAKRFAGYVPKARAKPRKGT